MAAHVADCAVVIVDGVAVTETAVMETAMPVKSMVAVPNFVGSSTEVALTVSEPEAGRLAGWVYSPELDMVPETADQVTTEL